jgi:hypothetical protein
MPLKKGKEHIGENIREMSKTHPHDQAVAAAMRMSGFGVGSKGDSKKKRKGRDA